MKSVLPMLFLIAFLIGSCTSKTKKIYVNDDINASVQKEIKQLNDQVFEAIKTKNPQLILSIMSDELKAQSASSIPRMVEIANQVIQAPAYKLIDQYYLIKSDTSLLHQLTCPRSDRNQYTINYQSANEETVTSLMVPNNNVDEFMLMTVYGKSRTEWKLNIMQFGRYSINKMTANEWLDNAMYNYNQGKLVNATNSIFLANQCLKPANIFLQYNSQDTITYLFERISKEANENFRFPREIEVVNSKPSVFKIFPFGTEEGYFPMVHYVSNIPISDIENLAYENDELHAQLASYFPGIHDNSVTLYQAFEAIGDGTTPIENYGFIKEN